MDSPHKGSVMRKVFSSHDVIMARRSSYLTRRLRSSFASTRCIVYKTWCLPKLSYRMLHCLTQFPAPAKNVAYDTLYVLNDNLDIINWHVVTRNFIKQYLIHLMVWIKYTIRPDSATYMYILLQIRSFFWHHRIICFFVARFYWTLVAQR